MHLTVVLDRLKRPRRQQLALTLNALVQEPSVPLEFPSREFVQSRQSHVFGRPGVLPGRAGSIHGVAILGCVRRVCEGSQI